MFTAKNFFFYLLWFLFLALGFYWIYAGTQSFPFQFDDIPNILQNRGIRYLEHPKAMLENLVGRTRIVTTYTYALNYYFFGLSLSAFRLVNFFLHIANSLLLGWLFYRWTKKTPLLAIAIFLFAPITVDSVIYLTGRSGLLSTFFVLVAIYLQGLRFFDTRPIMRIFVFTLVMALAILSKENAIAILLLIFLVQPFDQKRVMESFPLIVPALLASILLFISKWSYITNAILGVFRIHGELYSLPYDQFLLLQVSIWPRLISLILNPYLMSVDHSVEVPHTFFSPWVLMGIGIILIGIFSIYKCTKKNQFFYFCLSWFFICLLPTNSIVPTFDPLAERHIYMACIGLAWLIAALVMESQKLRNFWIFFFLLCFCLIPLSKERTLYWKTPYTLWSDAYQKYPEKYRIAMNTAYYASLEFNDRRPAVQIACKLLSQMDQEEFNFEQQELLLNFLEGNLNLLGIDKQNVGQSVEKNCTESGFWKELLILKLSMSWQEKRIWLSQFHKTFQEYSGQETVSRRGIEARREHTLDIYLGYFYIRLKDWQSARLLFEKVLFTYKDRHSPFWQTRETLGDIYSKLGMYEAAAKQYEICMYQYKVFKRYPKTLLKKIAQNYTLLGDTVRTKDAIGEMIQVYTDDPEVRVAYADILEKLGDKHQASQRKEANFYLRNAKNKVEQETVKP